MGSLNDDDLMDGSSTLTTSVAIVEVEGEETYVATFGNFATTTLA